MTRVILICALCGGLAIRVPAQPLSAWIEQLAALRTLQNTLRQGYATVSGGLQTIGDVRGQEYQLHQGYFTSLEGVKPVVLDDPRTENLRARLVTLMSQLQAALDDWQRQPILSR
jgi:hypothetical protein